MSALNPILTRSRWLRFTTLTSLYFAQGIPIGLLDVALPAWLAEQGVSAPAIGAYLAAIGLPWAFKLVMGPFMDRFRFPSMGRRRPWVLAAQSGLVVTLLVLALAPGADADMWLLTVLGFAVNSFAATQDVAVDGMAIDLLPNAERGRANAFMAFGQVAGYGLFGGLAGVLLVRFGLATTALVAASLVALIWLLVLVALEREGERRLPWSPGEAAPGAPAPDDIFGLFGDLVRGLLLPMSLLLTLGSACGRLAAGIGLALLPVFAVKELGYSTDLYSQLMAFANTVAALIGLFAGPLIDYYGPKRALIVGLLGKGAVVSLFALTPGLWSHHGYVLAILGAYLLFGQVFFIGVIAQYMNVTWLKVAATQFAVYMSVANLARSGGAGLYAALALELSTTGLLLVMAGLSFLGAAICGGFSQPSHDRRLARLAESDVTRAA